MDEMERREDRMGSECNRAVDTDWCIKHEANVEHCDIGLEEAKAIAYQEGYLQGQKDITEGVTDEGAKGG